MNMLNQYRWIAGIALGALLLAAAEGESGPVDTNPVAVTDPNDTNQVAVTDHKIAPLEIIIVEVFGEKDLSKELRVSASGKITFPLLGEVEVAGQTSAAVENKLKELLSKDLMVDPQVTVTVKEYRLRYVIVLGEVNRPGPVELKGEQKWTILDAIGQAGGLTRGARNTIEFTRQGITKKFGLDQLKKETDPKKVIYLEPGDIISVQQTFW